MTDTEQRVRKIISEHLGVTDFGWDADLVDDLGADSLDPIEAQMALEQEFNIRIPDEKVDAWRTAGDILNSVKEPV